MISIRIIYINSGKKFFMTHIISHGNHRNVSVVRKPGQIRVIRGQLGIEPLQIIAPIIAKIAIHMLHESTLLIGAQIDRLDRQVIDIFRVEFTDRLMRRSQILRVDLIGQIRLQTRRLVTDYMIDRLRPISRIRILLLLIRIRVTRTITLRSYWRQ